MSCNPDDVPSHSGPRPDDEEFRKLYLEHYARTVRLAYLLVRSHPIAEELAQEAFIRLYSANDVIRNPPGWLRTVVVHLASSWRGRRTMEEQRLQLMRPPRPAEPVEVDEAWEALGRLRPERSTVLILRYYEDLPYRAIATIVGCSAATARSRVRRALADLRTEMAQ